MEPSRVSVVVVSYNTRDKLRRCLSCIEPEHEVIVVDNASGDGSAGMVRTEFPHAKLFQNKENLGFGAANNQGMAVATRELILLLNSDCYAEQGAIAKLAEAVDGDVVAAGGRLLNPDGTTQDSVAGNLNLLAVFLEQTYLESLLKPASVGYWQSRGAINRWNSTKKAVPVKQVMGACLVMRPLERFDERFFLYCEDTDLCRRLCSHGQIVYWPEARFTHELGSSSAGASRWLSVARYNRGKELFFAIHHGPVACAACWLLDRLGALLRLIAYSLLTAITLGTRGRDRVTLWWRVLTTGMRGPDA